MLNRYPHTVTITALNLATADSEGVSYNGLVGNDPNQDLSETIKGRVEIKPGFITKGYVAKFYCAVQNVNLFKNDGLTLDFEGRKFNVVNWSQKQSHLVLWLKD